MEILAPIRGTIESLPRLGRQEVVRPGRTEGYWDMAGSNRSQDIHPHSACGSPAAGGTPSVVHARAPLRPRQTGALAGSNPKLPAATVSSLRVQRSQQRPRMVVTRPCARDIVRRFIRAGGDYATEQ